MNDYKLFDIEKNPYGLIFDRNKNIVRTSEPEVLPPENLNPKFFDASGKSTTYLKNLSETASQVFNRHATQSEKILGMYVVGSQSQGRSTPNSDIDIYLHATVGYSRSKDISNVISTEVNNLKPIFDTLGISLDATADELSERGLLKPEDTGSGIRMLHRMGLIHKSQIVDISVHGMTPYGLSYDLKNDKWVKFKEGTTAPGNDFCFSDMLRYGF
ncbi:MAG: hypothetical protein ACP5OA_03365 [Candidatus Woesearchaeota archaeon]